MKVLVFALTLVSVAFAEQEYYTFKTTWRRDPLFEHGFADQPRTESEAIALGFSKISSCGESDEFIGNLYVPTEFGQEFVLIYDVNGFIAGMHSVAAADTIHPDYFDFPNSPWYRKTDMVGFEAYVGTAYFVNPDIICSTGRTQEQFDTEGTLSKGLWFLKGTDLVSIPMTMEGAEQDDFWYKHLCLASMGVHYLSMDPKDNADEVSCFDIAPIQLLFDDGLLNGFVWQHIASSPGDRWEHPNPLGIPAVIDNPPTCLLDIAGDPGVVSMHVYVSQYSAIDVNCM